MGCQDSWELTDAEFQTWLRRRGGYRVRLASCGGLSCASVSAVASLFFTAGFGVATGYRGELWETVIPGRGVACGPLAWRVPGAEALRGARCVGASEARLPGAEAFARPSWSPQNRMVLRRVLTPPAWSRRELPNLRRILNPTLGLARSPT